MGHENDAVVTISGDKLTIADLIAASRHEVRCRITKDKSVLDKVDASVNFLAQQLEKGTPIYGINTGFGGSADTRTSQTIDLQKALVQLLQTGILLPSDVGMHDGGDSEAIASLNRHSLPRSAVRGAMLGRCNSLLRGHSAVRREVIETLMHMLNLDLIPVVPLRGSISASGDLMPLAYIAGAIEGNPGIHVSCPAKDGRKILPSNEALQYAGIAPLTLGPKEGLGIANGTIVSGTVAMLGFHETQYLALLAQALTGMCTEAMRGTIDNHHPFIATVRPHSGQIEAAENITRFFRGSRLATSHLSGAKTNGLAQDRYALRTASQWMGPYLEDLQLAAQQLETELNSTTDNPLIDVKNGHVHHGGNFQATSVTSATEKTRLSLQMLGKLMFAQSSELINPMMNGDLPPNLSFDDPSLSFTFKGIDINMAAYMSELGFLANPVSSHVQSAEMNNQAINSLALISARYTLDAVEIVSMMAASHLYACCQALDLQAMHDQLTERIRSATEKTMRGLFQSLLDGNELDAIVSIAFEAIARGLKEAKSKDIQQQSAAAADSTIAPLFAVFSKVDKSDEAKGKLFTSIAVWKEQCSKLVADSIVYTRRLFTSGASAITRVYLSHGSKKLYEFVRDDLRVPLHKGLVEHPTADRPSPEGIQVAANSRYIIGKQVSVIYQALRSGRIHNVLVESLL
ncbi:hypothetical protein M409DRAFT_38126 [Zasmidium cellare ATCC 36951]|uniref:Phenylalanine ammonia-lyase n=1 Tax=Zasmidium cellare ATCC 36951 TaxID=1080233 RepID=A0A6A6BVY7_ZASCE|nr:uncharacterized protein M409DRAFT_38126 [Zasmidium cellare ATCC 36951]KAF2158713.1 hypothetical protein M409DRAFT_38126 [Zasmidium cellare ATCC 36951]